MAVFPKRSSGDGPITHDFQGLTRSSHVNSYGIPIANAGNYLLRQQQLRRTTNASVYRTSINGYADSDRQFGYSAIEGSRFNNNNFRQGPLPALSDSSWHRGYSFGSAVELNACKDFLARLGSTIVPDFNFWSQYDILLRCSQCETPIRGMVNMEHHIRDHLESERHVCGFSCDAPERMMDNSWSPERNAPMGHSAENPTSRLEEETLAARSPPGSRPNGAPIAALAANVSA
ncbi:uncharacterized protein LOC100900961 [Galendromus occidentalis]|uniref:Uncharacterized protein LOC100900961 n=1 Tax=Galendromus occidentalis TaxID=34638 RepID=A0AAJ6VVB1_9ACAR|nr:uncharacterized protein LOC100900961 [Galendromus occidentalis]